MGMFDGVLGSVGDIVGSALSYFGTKSTNEDQIGIANANNIFNAQQAQQAEDFSASQAQINRDFQSSQVNQMEQYQTEMSNSAYQRAVQGMEAAGLNPMLAYQQGPASTPSGGMASGSAPSGVAASSAGIPRITSPMGAAVNTAYAGARLIGDLRQSFAQADKAEAEADNTRAVNALVGPKMEQDIRTGASSAQQLDALASRIYQMLPYDKLRSQTDSVESMGRARKTGVDTQIEQDLYSRGIPVEQAQAELDATRAGVGLRNAQAVMSTQSARALGLKMPQLENEAGAQSSWWMKNISPYLPDVLKGAHSASALSNVMD